MPPQPASFERFDRDRYDPDDLIAQLARQQPQLVAGRWEVELDAPLCEIRADLPDAQGSCSQAALDFLAEVLRHLRTMDNLVQESCEKQFALRRQDPKSHDLCIGWITVTDADLTGRTITLTYYGLNMNTQWDAKFKRDDNGGWQPANFGLPAGSAT